MYKKIILLLILFAVSGIFLIAQVNADTLIAKNKIKKCIIKAEQFQNDSLVAFAKNIETYNEYGRSTSFTSFDKNDKQTDLVTYYYHDKGMTEEEFDINEKGDTFCREIYRLTPSGDVTDHYQIKYKTGDTLVSQKWVKDSKGRDSVLYNEGKIAMQWFYDAQGNPINDKYVYEREGNCVTKYEKTGRKKKIISKTYSTPTEKTSYLFYNSNGYLYGIILDSVNGGKRIERKNENGLLTEIVYMNATGHITARLTYTYEY